MNTTSVSSQILRPNSTILSSSSVTLRPSDHSNVSTELPNNSSFLALSTPFGVITNPAVSNVQTDTLTMDNNGGRKRTFQTFTNEVTSVSEVPQTIDVQTSPSSPKKIHHHTADTLSSLVSGTTSSSTLALNHSVVQNSTYNSTIHSEHKFQNNFSSKPGNAPPTDYYIYPPVENTSNSTHNSSNTSTSFFSLPPSFYPEVPNPPNSINNGTHYRRIWKEQVHSWIYKGNGKWKYEGITELSPSEYEKLSQIEYDYQQSKKHENMIKLKPVISRQNTNPDFQTFHTNPSSTNYESEYYMQPVIPPAALHSVNRYYTTFNNDNASLMMAPNNSRTSSASSNVSLPIFPTPTLNTGTNYYTNSTETSTKDHGVSNYGSHGTFKPETGSNIVSLNSIVGASMNPDANKYLYLPTEVIVAALRQIKNCGFLENILKILENETLYTDFMKIARSKNDGYIIQPHNESIQALVSLNSDNSVKYPVWNGYSWSSSYGNTNTPSRSFPNTNYSFPNFPQLFPTSTLPLFSYTFSTAMDVGSLTKGLTTTTGGILSIPSTSSSIAATNSSSNINSLASLNNYKLSMDSSSMNSTNPVTSSSADPGSTLPISSDSSIPLQRSSTGGTVLSIHSTDNDTTLFSSNLANTGSSMDYFRPSSSSIQSSSDEHTGSSHQG